MIEYALLIQELNTGLIWAVKQNDIKMIKLLIEYKADTNAINEVILL